MENVTVTPPTKILVVDDYPENLLALHALLKRDDIELVEARSGQEALEALLVHEVAVSLIDVQMPEMDGFELAQIMHSTERTRRIPIVFVTATPRDQQRIFHAYSVGAVDFLSKPIEPEVLKSKVDVFVQLHRHKQQLAEQIEIQKEMLRVNELLTAGISHDLRNPLNLVLNAAEIIREFSEEERSRRAAELIRNGGKRLQRIIEELLDFSQVRLTGTLRLNASVFDLAETAQRIVTEHQLTVTSPGISLNKVGDLTVQGDEVRIGRLLSNLIGNALMHGETNQAVRVEVDGTDSAAITISVHNKGHIPQEVLPTLFKPFKMVEQRRSSRGLGLGLYIVDQIAKLHSGTIAVESTATSGTRFTVRLPRLPRMPATDSVH